MKRMKDTRGITPYKNFISETDLGPAYKTINNKSPTFLFCSAKMLLGYDIGETAKHDMQ